MNNYPPLCGWLVPRRKVTWLGLQAEVAVAGWADRGGRTGCRRTREVKMEASKGSTEAPCLLKATVEQGPWGFPPTRGRVPLPVVDQPEPPSWGSVHASRGARGHLNKSSNHLPGVCCMRADHQPRCNTTIKQCGHIMWVLAPKHTYLALLYTKLAPQCAGAGRHGRLIDCGLSQLRAPTGEVMVPECTLLLAPVWGVER